MRKYVLPPVKDEIAKDLPPMMEKGRSLAILRPVIIPVVAKFVVNVRQRARWTVIPVIRTA